MHALNGPANLYPNRLPHIVLNITLLVYADQFRAALDLSNSIGSSTNRGTESDMD